MKSAYELAMERLNKEIAELESLYASPAETNIESIWKSGTQERTNGPFLIS